MEKDIKDKNLEQLENDYCPEYDYETYLIERCYKLRKIKIRDLSIENLRMLLGQNIGNKFLIPLAIEILEENILSEGDHFEGDLLLNLLNSDKKYWETNQKEYFKTIQIIDNNIDIIQSMETIKEIKDSINGAINDFKNYKKRLPTTGST